MLVFTNLPSVKIFSVNSPNTDFDYGNVFGNYIVQSFITYNPLQKSLRVWKIDGIADTLMPIVNIDDIELFTRSA